MCTQSVYMITVRKMGTKKGKHGEERKKQQEERNKREGGEGRASSAVTYEVGRGGVSRKLSAVRAFIGKQT